MKISIIGSCQTRDIFNSKFIPSYKEYFTLGSYFPMTSMLSVMGKEAVVYNYQKLIGSGMNKNQMEHWYYELEKPMLTTLENNPPEYLLMDFYADARYGARMYQDEYLVNRLSRLKGKDIIEWNELSMEYSYKKNTEDFLCIWKKAVGRFMDFMQRKLPNTKIIINTVKGNNLVTDDKNGTEWIQPDLQDLDIERINAIWYFMDNYIIDQYHVEAITYEKTYTLDPEYKYGGLGVALVHFHSDYYEDYFKKLVQLTTNSEPKPYPVGNISRPNLLLASSFDYGADRCNHQAGKFQTISRGSYEAISPADCRQELGDYRPQMWSKPLEVDGDGEMRYSLTFLFRASDPNKLEAGMVIFAIRVFKGVKSCKKADCIQEFAIKLQENQILDDRTYLCTYNFRPKGKFVKAGPFLFQYIPGIEYAQMKLERIE